MRCDAASGRGELLRCNDDLRVRAAQTYLTFLGYVPHGVDGIMGRMTRAAMNDYQAASAMPRTDFVDDATFAALSDDCRPP